MLLYTYKVRMTSSCDCRKHARGRARLRLLDPAGGGRLLAAHLSSAAVVRQCSADCAIEAVLPSIIEADGGIHRWKGALHVH